MQVMGGLSEKVTSEQRSARGEPELGKDLGGEICKVAA